MGVLGVLDTSPSIFLAFLFSRKVVRSCQVSRGRCDDRHLITALRHPRMYVHGMVSVRYLVLVSSLCTRLTKPTDNNVRQTA